MQNFDFQNPTKILFGKNTIPRLGTEVKDGGLTKVLLIAGGGSIKKNGVYEQSTASLKQAGIEWVEAWGVRANPVLAKAREMVALARESGAEAIVALGGGSVIDSAKVVAAGVHTEDVWRIFETHTPVTNALPLYTVLTLSATGTEMNQFAVLTNEAEKKKWAISGPALYPRTSIIDPSVQQSLPWNQTVNGAIDAISHTMEFYFLDGGCETTLALDESLLRTIVKVTDRLQKDPADYDARASLAWAATVALNGISGAGIGAGDWATHGLEHGLSAVAPSVAHGAGLGVLFPAWILYCQEANPEHFRRWAGNVWEADSVEEGVARYRAKIRSWGGAVTLKELGIVREQLDEIATNAHAVGIPGTVKELTLADLRAILESCYQ